MAQTRRYIEFPGKRRFQAAIARDLASDIADDAAKANVEEFNLAPMTLELLGMGVSLRLDQSPLADHGVTLAQFHIVSSGQLCQSFGCGVKQLRICRKRNVFRLYGRVDADPLDVAGIDSPRAHGGRQAFLNQFRETLCAKSLTPAGDRRAIERGHVPEECLAAEVLEIRVLDPTRELSCSSLKLYMCLRIMRPNIKRIGKAGLPVSENRGAAVASNRCQSMACPSSTSS